MRVKISGGQGTGDELERMVKAERGIHRARARVLCARNVPCSVEVVPTLVSPYIFAEATGWCVSYVH